MGRTVNKRPLLHVQVSRWQVAELVAAAVANPSVVENKILEVVAEETAPLRWGYPQEPPMARLSPWHVMLLRLHAVPARLLSCDSSFPDGACILMKRVWLYTLRSLSKMMSI